MVMAVRTASGDGGGYRLRGAQGTSAGGNVCGWGVGDVGVTQTQADAPPASPVRSVHLAVSTFYKPRSEKGRKTRRGGGKEERRKKDETRPLPRAASTGDEAASRGQGCACHSARGTAQALLGREHQGEVQALRVQILPLPPTGRRTLAGGLCLPLPAFPLTRGRGSHRRGTILANSECSINVHYLYRCC